MDSQGIRHGLDFITKQERRSILSFIDPLIRKRSKIDVKSKEDLPLG